MEMPNCPTVRIELGDEEKLCCSNCGEIVSDQIVTLYLTLKREAVRFTECAGCREAQAREAKIETEREGDR